jgi:hypothetical protein
MASFGLLPNEIILFIFDKLISCESHPRHKLRVIYNISLSCKLFRDIALLHPSMKYIRQIKAAGDHSDTYVMTCIYLRATLVNKFSTDIYNIVSNILEELNASHEPILSFPEYPTTLVNISGMLKCLPPKTLAGSSYIIIKPISSVLNWKWSISIKINSALKVLTEMIIYNNKKNLSSYYISKNCPNWEKNRDEAINVVRRESTYYRYVDDIIDLAHRIENAIFK